MLVRSWLIFTVVIGIVQCVLAFLAILQHDAIYSDLVRQRISVIAQTIVASYKPITDLGLPISMIRNGDAIVARALAMDGEILAVHAFNTSGVIVHSTQNPRPQMVSPDVLRQMQLSDDDTWSAETDMEVFSGRNVPTVSGDVAGAVVVVYPKGRMEAASDAILQAVLRAALLTWLLFSAAAYLLLRLILAAPRRAMTRLEAISREETRIGGEPNNNSRGRQETSDGLGLLGAQVSRLTKNLEDAERRYDEAMRALDAANGTHAAAGERRMDTGPSEDPDAPPSSSDPSRSLSRALAGRLAPPAAIMITASALVLGVTILSDVNRAIEPELAARTNLIGTIVSENVQRAVAAGAPLDKLVGAEKYFGDMLTQLPEVAYVAVATGRIILEAGERIDPYLAPPRERKDVRSHPIMHDGEEIAYVVIDIDPAFISRKFRDVFLDMSVVILVTVLIAFEIMVLLTSRSLTASLDRLQRLTAMQAAGDFSRSVDTTTRGAVADLTRLLSARAASLHAALGRAQIDAKTEKARSAIAAACLRYRISDAQSAPLRISYFTDIRLALFLFGAANELPLSFLPLYTRAADNLWPWLDESVLISLPLAGYLLATVIAAPYSRALTARFGVRSLFLVASLPMVGAHLGLYLADTAQEVVLWRTATGLGYALVTLACQDYVLDTAPPAQRDRTLGIFTLVLVGGLFAGAALGGVLADRLGQRNVFLLSAALIAMSMLLSARFIAPGVVKNARGGATLSLAAIVAPLRVKRFAALVFGLAIPANVLLQAFISYLVALTFDSFGASTADISRALMLCYLGILLAGPLGGRLSEAGIPVGQVALAATLLAGVALAFFVVWPVEAVLIGAIFCAGIGHGVVRGAQVSLAMTIAETDLERSGSVAVLGALRTLERLGSMIGLLLIAGIAGAAGLTIATGAVAIWLLVGAALFALVFLGRSVPATADDPR